ncbi:MAG: hypothetical protein MJ125_06190, partial [Clostridia bacterium]|nr:hypothetical protein [Clostridia bacterium]
MASDKFYKNSHKFLIPAVKAVLVGCGLHHRNWRCVCIGVDIKTGTVMISVSSQYHIFMKFSF